MKRTALERAWLCCVLMDSLAFGLWDVHFDLQRLLLVAWLVGLGVSLIASMVSGVACRSFDFQVLVQFAGGWDARLRSLL